MPITTVSIPLGHLDNKNSELDDNVANLALLTIGLPDPDQQLFLRNTGLEVFDIFDKLPTEIRLVIWRAALPPPRIVHLESECLWAQSSRFFSRSRIQQKAPPYPASLYVNRESRSETLKHYRLIPVNVAALHKHLFPGPYFFGPKRSICVDIKRDLMVFSSMFNFFEFSTFHSIEFDLSGGGFEGVPLLVLDGIDNVSFRYNPKVKRYSFLEEFPSLKRLVILAPDYLGENFITDTSERGGQYHRQQVELYMKGLAGDDTGRTTPEVLLMPQHKVDTSFQRKLDSN
jgi:hypothetical protein